MILVSFLLQKLHSCYSIQRSSPKKIEAAPMFRWASRLHQTNPNQTMPSSRLILRNAMKSDFVLSRRSNRGNIFSESSMTLG